MNRAWGLLLAVLGLPGALGAQTLLDQPQTFPWNVGLTPVVLDGPGTLAPGRGQVQTTLLWCNTYRQLGFGWDQTQEVDGESLILSQTLRWAPTEGQELSAQVQGWATGGGFMDAGLQAFHQALGVSNQGREGASNGAVRDYLAGVFDLEGGSLGLTQASLRWRVTRGPWSATAWVKVPVPGRLDWAWSRTPGAGAALEAARQWPLAGPWALGLAASAGAAAVGTDPVFPGQTGPWLVQAAGALWVGTEAWGRGSAQVSWASVPRTGAMYLGEPAGLATFGYTSPRGPWGAWQIGMTEEFLTWATMEVGFQVGWVQDF